jgi:hypothetical protein
MGSSRGGARRPRHKLACFPRLMQGMVGAMTPRFALAILLAQR